MDGWAKLEKVKRDCIRLKPCKQKPDFSRYINLYDLVLFEMLGNPPRFCRRGFVDVIQFGVKHC